MEGEKEWVFDLDVFLSMENKFSAGRGESGDLLRQALENNPELADQVSDALQRLGIRDPRNRKNPNPEAPMTPGEIFLSDDSLKLLVRCAQTVQDELVKMRDRGVEAAVDLNLVDEILRNVRLRAPKSRKTGFGKKSGGNEGGHSPPTAF